MNRVKFSIGFENRSRASLLERLFSRFKNDDTFGYMRTGRSAFFTKVRSEVVVNIDTIWKYTKSFKVFLELLCRTITHEYLHFFAPDLNERTILSIEGWR